MTENETIAALSTPAGYAGIAVIRISGNEAFRIISEIFKRPGGKSFSQMKSNSICYGHILDEKGAVIDEVLVSKLCAPHTYTTEDVVEINCHGGYAAVREVMSLLIRRGARHALPGEFTKRAFLGGRIDLVQAEAVSDLIASKTELCAKAALNQLEGALSEEIDGIKNDILQLLMQLEVTIQYPEYDIEDMPSEKLMEGLLNIKAKLRNLADSYKKGSMLNEGVKVAIIGKPNVGKSMLLNKLLNKEKAIVTDIPGTTRDVVDEYINLRGLPVRIMDTAGIRSSDDKVEKIGIDRSYKAIKQADYVLLTVNASQPLDDEDMSIINAADTEKTIFVLNKCDIGVCESVSEYLKDFDSVNISAMTGENIKVLEDKIYNRAVTSEEDFAKAALITNERHASLIQGALMSITKAEEAIAQGYPVDISEIDIRDCMDSLGMITGEVTSEDIIDEIFANFCLGK